MIAYAMQQLTYSLGQITNVNVYSEPMEVSTLNKAKIQESDSPISKSMSEQRTIISINQSYLFATQSHGSI